MKVLHISSDYCKQSIYRDLMLQVMENASNVISKLDVFVPVRSKGELSKYSIDDERIGLTRVFLLNKWDRFLYFKKLNKVNRKMESLYQMEDYNLIHAHFLFSDGGVALKIKKKYGIPYVVAIRSTDINLFFRVAIHLRSYGKEILKEAEKIVFITPGYVDRLRGYVGDLFFQSIQKKIEIIPNGITPEWYSDRRQEKKDINADDLKFLYVGDFSPNKNIPWVISEIFKSYPKAKLDIVGSKGEDTDNIERLSEKYDGVTLSGRIENKKELMDKYQKSDIFLLLSQKETFGLVYIEAISKGVPILYTKGQGVDGYFNKDVGYPVEFQNSEDFKAKVDLIIKNYDELSQNTIAEVEQFKWNVIAKKYLNIYKEICLKN